MQGVQQWHRPPRRLGRVTEEGAFLPGRALRNIYDSLREMEAALRDIYDRENAPTGYALYKLQRKAGHAYTKKQIDDFVKRQAAAQVLTARREPGRVAGKFQATRQNEKWQADLLDRSTKPSELDGVKQTYVLVVVDVYTRRGYLQPLSGKDAASVLNAYKMITARAQAHPQILNLDKEGATLTSEKGFERFLDANGTVWRRAEGRNDLAIVDAYMGRLGIELGRIRLAKKLRVDQWAPQIASAEASLNRKPMATLRGNAPDDVAEAIASNDPEKKVIEFQQLEQMAVNISTNRVEDRKVNRALEETTAFRAPLQAEAGQKGPIAARNRPGEARYQGAVRTLRGGKVEFGRAVDNTTGESFPAKLVVAVPPGSEQIPDAAIKQGRPEWRTRQNWMIFSPFLKHAVDFVRQGANGSRSGGKLKSFLVQIPGLDFNDAVRRAFGADKSPIKEFLETFADTFTWNKSLTSIEVKPSALPARAGPARRLRGKQPVPERTGGAQPATRVSAAPSLSRVGAKRLRPAAANLERGRGRG